MTTPLPRLAGTLAGLSEAPTDERRRLQRRLALLGRTGFIIAVTFIVVSIGLDGSVADGDWRASFTDPFRSLLLLEALPFAILWGFVRRGAPALSTLRLLDAGTTIGLVGLATLSSRHSGRPAAPGDAVLAGMAALVFRAVVVPARPGWTALTGSVAVAPLAVSLLLPADAWHLIRTGTPEEIRVTVGTYLFWVVLAVVLATLTSRVIYGLRQRVSSVESLGQYWLEERLGAGGMGEVYRARHAMLRRPTAVKLLRPEHAGEEHVKRFEREVQETARLTHPNTVAIYDYGRTDEGIFYYAMELLEGLDLRRFVASHGPMPPARSVHVLRQVCLSLAEAHGLGIIHRDIKPANIILTRRGGVDDFVKVVDFGLAKSLEPNADSWRTQEAVLMGTPGYLAPELVRSPSNAGPASDIYAVGATAYYLVTGTEVFSAGTIMEICAHHLHTAPEPPSSRCPGGVPFDLERLILRCLSKEPNDRPGSVAELEAELGACSIAGSWTERDARQWWAEARADKPVVAPVTFHMALEGSASATIKVDPRRCFEASA